MTAPPSAIETAVPHPVPAPEAIDQAFQALAQRLRLPGAQYLWSVDGQVKAEAVHGLADARRSTPVGVRTAFNLYSITKPCTAATALALARAGRLDPDAPLARACGLDALQGFGTVHEALLHRAGMPNPLPLRWVHRDTEDAAFDERAFVDARLAALRGKAGRRGRQRYSNPGYLAVGRAIERASGQALRAALRATVLDRVAPLPGAGLDFATAEAGAQARGLLPARGWLSLLLGLLIDRDRLVEGRAGPWLQVQAHQVDGSAYGGLIGNARGLAGLAHALFGFGRAAIPPFDDEPGRAALGATVPGEGRPRTLAWFEGRLLGHRWLGHAGGGLGGYGEWRIYPEQRAVSVLLTNTPGLREHTWLDAIDAAALGMRMNT